MKKNKKKSRKKPTVLAPCALAINWKTWFIYVKRFWYQRQYYTTSKLWFLFKQWMTSAFFFTEVYTLHHRLPFFFVLLQNKSKRTVQQWKSVSCGVFYVCWWRLVNENCCIQPWWPLTTSNKSWFLTHKITYAVDWQTKKKVQTSYVTPSVVAEWSIVIDHSIDLFRIPISWIKWHPVLIGCNLLQFNCQYFCFMCLNKKTRSAATT